MAVALLMCEGDTEEKAGVLFNLLVDDNEDELLSISN